MSFSHKKAIIHKRVTLGVILNQTKAKIQKITKRALNSRYDFRAERMKYFICTYTTGYLSIPENYGKVTQPHFPHGILLGNSPNKFKSLW